MSSFKVTERALLQMMTRLFNGGELRLIGADHEILVVFPIPDDAFVVNDKDEVILTKDLESNPALREGKTEFFDFLTAEKVVVFTGKYQILKDFLGGVFEASQGQGTTISAPSVLSTPSKRGPNG